MLVLGDNNITSVPSEIGLLTKMESIYFGE